MLVNDVSLWTAFLAGLLGSVHCIGMCGGIVGALTMGLQEDIRHTQSKLLPYLAMYNVGRIASYMTAGALVGFLGAQFTNLLPQPMLVGRLMAGIFMIILGLYIADWWRALVVLERGGAYLWKRVEPLGRRFLPVRNLPHALGLGLIWGWLPCGLVYGALVLALTSGNAVQGGLIMLAFGLGTLPMLLAIGSTASWLNEITRKAIVRQTMGLLIILFGLYTLFAPHKHGGHDHSGHDMNMSSESAGSAMDHSGHQVPMPAESSDMPMESSDSEPAADPHAHHH